MAATQEIGEALDAERRGRFEVLFATRRERLWRICRSRLGPGSGALLDADDAVQEAFLRLMRQDGREPKDEAAYLEGIARNVCMDAWRRRYRASEKEVSGDLVVDAEEIATRRQDLAQLWEELSERDRELVTLAYEGYRQAEIAVHLDISEGHVRVLLYRLRRRLLARAGG